MTRLELRHLRHFVAVAETLNFTRAAQRVHLGQQGFSASIQQLERILGVPLLTRDSRNVALTAAGEALLPEARLTLGQAARAADAAIRAGTAARPIVGIGYVPASAAGIIPPLLVEIQRSDPAVLVATKEGWREDLTAQLRAGELDLVLLRFPAPDDGLESRHVRDDDLHVAVALDHPLAGRAEVALAELAGETLLVRPQSDSYNALVRAACREAGFAPTELVTPVIGNPALGPVVTGDAFALVNAGLLERYPQPVALLRIRPPTPTLPLHAVLAPGPRRPAAALALRALAALATRPRPAG